MSANALEKSSYAWGLSDCDSKEQDICVSTEKLDIFYADGHWAML